MTPDELLTRVRQDAAFLPRAFAAAGRALGVPDPVDVWLPTEADIFRIALLRAVPSPPLQDLWRHGDSAERRAVLRAIDALPAPEHLDLVPEALRTNDIRLVAAALTPLALASLDEAALGQAVLKVAFLDLDLRRIPGISSRVTPALVHQLMGLVLERVAAGRSAPLGVWELVAAFPDDDAEEVLREELWSPVPARRDAACRAFLGLEAALR